MLFPALSNFLAGDAGVSALCGDRVYAVQAPRADDQTLDADGPALLPRVVLERVSTRPDGRHLGGRLPAATLRLNARCVAGDLTTADALAHAVARAMGTLIDTTINSDPPGSGDDVRVKRADLEDLSDATLAPRTGRPRSEYEVDAEFTVFWHDSEALPSV